MVYLNTFWKLSTSFLLYFIPSSCTVHSSMTFSFTPSFILFTYHSLHLFLYGSISFPRSLFVSFSLSSSFTFPKALFFSLSLCLFLSPTHYCSSLPLAHLQRPFFSFPFFMAVTVKAAVTLQTSFTAHALTVCFQSFDPPTVNQPLS